MESILRSAQKVCHCSRGSAVFECLRIAARTVFIQAITREYSAFGTREALAALVYTVAPELILEKACRLTGSCKVSMGLSIFFSISAYFLYTAHLKPVILEQLIVALAGVDMLWMACQAEKLMGTRFGAYSAFYMCITSAVIYLMYAFGMGTLGSTRAKQGLFREGMGLVFLIGMVLNCKPLVFLAPIAAVLILELWTCCTVRRHADHGLYSVHQHPRSPKPLAKPRGRPRGTANKKAQPPAREKEKEKDREKSGPKATAHRASGSKRPLRAAAKQAMESIKKADKKQTSQKKK